MFSKDLNGKRTIYQQIHSSFITGSYKILFKNAHLWMLVADDKHYGLSVWKCEIHLEITWWLDWSVEFTSDAHGKICNTSVIITTWYNFIGHVWQSDLASDDAWGA